MPVIDPDPHMLRHSAEAALHAAEESWIHIQAEMAAADGDYDALMATLMPNGPYGYTIQPQINPDGTVRAPIITTWDEIRTAYEEVRGRSDLLSAESLIELRGTWYMFQESVSTGHVKGEPEPSPGTHLLGLFPVGSGKGISGELVWPVLPPAFLGRGEADEGMPTDPVEKRRTLTAVLDRYLDALRAHDVDAIVDTFNDDVQSGVRDYVADTGALVELQGKDRNRAHYAAFAEKYEIRSLDLLHRVVQEWYAFYELRLTVAPRDGSGPAVSFNTAQFDVVAKDGRFFVRIGHGTDPVAVD